MKTFKFVLAFGVMVGMVGPAWAGEELGQCPPGQTLRRIATTQTDDAVYSTQGEQVRAILVQCTGTACTSGFYDATTLGGASTANLVLDVGGAANAFVMVPTTGFFESPLVFKTGVVFVDDGNTNVVSLLGCQPA